MRTKLARCSYLLQEIDLLHHAHPLHSTPGYLMGQEAGLTPMSAEGKAVELCGMTSWESAAGRAKALSSSEGKSKINRFRRLTALAEELNCTIAQLALAWCLTNEKISTVITEASRPQQVT